MTPTGTSTARCPTPRSSRRRGRWGGTRSRSRIGSWPEAPDLDLASRVEDPWRGTISLRWVLVHLVEGYARHDGHADLLRERIDGRVGR